ncbi:hypothetical protein Avbf_04835 [Armadillidium vulgare]|nr:hypothetical protein Avbf_04835 [Armadillidium vulgare]
MKDIMTKGSTKVKRKVTFDLPESDYESDSDSSDNSDDFQIPKSRPKKIWPKESPKKYDPPPLNSDYKLKPILKNKNTSPYQEPVLGTSLLPAHIINSIINAKFGPSFSDIYDEESDSGNSSDESETLTSYLYLKTKGNLDVESNTSRQNSFEELNRDDWLKDLPEVESDDNNNISLVDCLISEQNLELKKALSNTNSDIIPINIDQNLSSSSDLSESSESSDKPIAKKPRRKFKVIVRGNSGDTDSEETFELEVSKKLSSPSENQIPNNISTTNILYYKAHEISYLGQQCDDNFDSIPVISEKLSLVSYSDYSNALVRFPPVVLQSSNEISEESETKQESELEENNSNNPFFDQIRNQENISSYLENILNNIEDFEPFDLLAENTRTSSNQDLTCTNESSPEVLKESSSPYIEINYQQPHTNPNRNTTPEVIDTAEPQPTERQHRSSGHKRQRSQHKSSKKRVFTAVRLPSESEESLPTPSKRNIKPYTKKPRKPLLKLVMEYSDSVNCAGEPEVLSPHKFKFP